MISVTTDTLVTGIDRWHLEKLLDFDFFWYASPFEHSKSKGFILPRSGFSLKTPATLVVDLSETEKDDILAFDPANTVFYSEEWRGNASVVASFVRNIVSFSDGKSSFVKKDHRIVGVTPQKASPASNIQ